MLFIAYVRFHFYIFLKSSSVSHWQLREAVTASMDSTAFEVNVVEWMTRTALELVGQEGLKHSFDSLVSNTSTSLTLLLRNSCEQLFQYLEIPSSDVSQPNKPRLQLWRILAPYLVPYVCLRIRRLLVKRVPHKNGQKLRMISETLAEQSQKIYQTKMAALTKGDNAVMQQISEGKDIISVLSKLNRTLC